MYIYIYIQIENNSIYSYLKIREKKLSKEIVHDHTLGDLSLNDRQDTMCTRPLPEIRFVPRR